MINNNAQGHVEMILSAILFIGFLLFVFLFLNPSLRTAKDIDIDNIQNKIINEISFEIGKLSVILDHTSNNCYHLNEVTDDYGANFIEKIGPDPRVYTIYFADFFSGTISCSLSTNKDFKYGVYSKENFIYDAKVSNGNDGFKERYLSNYNKLKTDLGISDDFTFEFRNINTKVIIPALSIENPNLPNNVNIISKDFPVKVINNNADITIYELNLKVWR